MEAENVYGLAHQHLNFLRHPQYLLPVPDGHVVLQNGFRHTGLNERPYAQNPDSSGDGVYQHSSDRQQDDRPKHVPLAPSPPLQTVQESDNYPLNPKQIRRILKRREERNKLKEATPVPGKRYKYESRHLQAKTRVRSASGRFCAKGAADQQHKVSGESADYSRSMTQELGGLDGSLNRDTLPKPVFCYSSAPDFHETQLALQGPLPSILESQPFTSISFSHPSANTQVDSADDSVHPFTLGNLDLDAV